MTHHCHWPGCTKEVPPKMWGCKTHWMKLPIFLRAKIRNHYRKGQEIDKNPSKQYIRTARLVQKWIRENEQQPNEADK